MDAQSIREQAFQTPRKKQDIATPFWPKADGTLAIGDMTVDELNVMFEVQKANPLNYSSTLICYALVSRETGNRVFGTTNERCEFMPTDRDWIKSQASVIAEILPEINAFFRLDGGTARKAIEDAKKNLLKELVSLGTQLPSELPEHLSRLLNN